jgi:hypothetical protein
LKPWNVLDSSVLYQLPPVVQVARRKWKDRLDAMHLVDDEDSMLRISATTYSDPRTSIGRRILQQYEYSAAPSSAPTGLCQPFSEDKCKGDGVLMHRDRIACIEKCVTQEKVEKFESLGWICGSCD